MPRHGKLSLCTGEHRDGDSVNREERQVCTRSGPSTMQTKAGNKAGGKECEVCPLSAHACGRWAHTGTRTEASALRFRLPHTPAWKQDPQKPAGRAGGASAPAAAQCAQAAGQPPPLCLVMRQTSGHRRSVNESLTLRICSVLS